MCIVKWIFLSENLKIFIYEKIHKKFKIWLKIWNKHKKEKYFRQISVSLQVRFMDKWHFCRKMGSNILILILILIFYVFSFLFLFSIKDLEKNVDVPRCTSSKFEFNQLTTLFNKFGQILDFLGGIGWF